MRNGIRVFDADAHVIYPADLWPRFLDRRYLDRVGRRQPLPGWEHYNPTTVDGRWTQHPTTLYGQFQKYASWSAEDLQKKYGDVLESGFRGDHVADALARDGIDFAVIYGPEYDCWFEGIDAEMQAAMVRAYNRWGAEMREQSGGRLCAAAPVPLLDVSRALEEIRYAHEKLDARCFWARPNPFNTRNLGDRCYDPIWELLQDLDAPFATHEFMGLGGRSFGVDRYRSFVEWHSVVHTFEAMGAMLSMIVNGVFERFPRLRVAYLEAGCGWLPSWLHRIDEQLELAPLEFPDLTMSATEYFRRNCWISTECEDRFVADVIRWLGDGHIVFESDFPHPDSKFPHSTEHFLALEGVSEQAKRRILWDNALDFYRFPKTYLPAGLRE